MGKSAKLITVIETGLIFFAQNIWHDNYDHVWHWSWWNRSATLLLLLLQVRDSLVPIHTHTTHCR